jgi:hypothetical protein
MTSHAMHNAQITNFERFCAKFNYRAAWPLHNHAHERVTRHVALSSHVCTHTHTCKHAHSHLELQHGLSGVCEHVRVACHIALHMS